MVKAFGKPLFASQFGREGYALLTISNMDETEVQWFLGF